MTYRVPCPSCKVVNNLKTADLGKSLRCGACAGSFVFGDDILADLKRRRAEQERRETEERNAAERERLERERAAREAKEAADAIRREAEEKHRREQAMVSPTVESPKAAPDYLAIQVIGILSRLSGIGAIIASFGDVFATMASRRPELGPGGPTAIFCFGVLMLAVGEGLSALRDIARNSWR